MDPKVMKTLTGKSTCVLTNEKDLTSSKPTSFTAVISGVDGVYCLFTGTVEFVGYFNGICTISMLVTNHELVRYLFMDTSVLQKNLLVNPGEYIGKANRRRGLGFEYCTQWRGESKYPVRLNNRTYYKQNPMDLLNGLYIPPRELAVIQGITRPNDIVEFTAEEIDEWGTDADIAMVEAEGRIEAAKYNPNSG